MSTGGPLQECSIKGRIFPCTSDGEANRDLGGFKGKTEMNGDGSKRRILERKAWGHDIVLSIDDARGDQEFLQEVADGVYGEDVDITLTYVTGLTYGGKGNIEDDIIFDAKTSTAKLRVAGGNKLEAQ